jgi:hypothetical protein
MDARKSTIVGIFMSLITYLIIVTIVILAITYGIWTGPIVLVLGFFPWLVAFMGGIKLSGLIPDIIFGVVDTGLMVACSIIGAIYLGIVGAIVGAGVGDAITDSLGGLFEGGIALKLRTLGIEEARTPLGCSMGKLSGCLLGAGTTISIAQILGLAVTF